MDKFDLKKFITEGKLLKENNTQKINTNIYYVEEYNDFNQEAVPEYEIDDVKAMLSSNAKNRLYIKKGTKGDFNNGLFTTDEGSDTRVKPEYIIENIIGENTFTSNPNIKKLKKGLTVRITNNKKNTSGPGTFTFGSASKIGKIISIDKNEVTVEIDKKPIIITPVGSNGNMGGDLETSGSVSMWVKLDSMSANGFLFQLQAEEGTDDQIILLWNNASGVIRGNVKFAGTTNIVESEAGLENDGNWHHVALMFPAIGSDVTDSVLYVDGSPDPISASSPQPVNTGSMEDLRVGSDSVFSDHFNGIIDEVRLYETDLSSNDLAALFLNGTMRFNTSNVTVPPVVEVLTVNPTSGGTATVTGELLSYDLSKPSVKIYWGDEDALALYRRRLPYP